MQKVGRIAVLATATAVLLTGCNSDRLYSLEGDVSFNKRPLEGVSLAISGPSGDSVTSGSDGGFVAARLRPGTYTVTPALDGYTFSPDSAQVVVDASGAESVAFEASDVDAPEAPQKLEAVAMHGGGVHLRWVAPVAATRYSIFRGATPDSIDFNNPIATLVDEPSFLDGGALPGKAYSYVVAARGPFGESVLSDAVSVNAGLLGAVLSTGDGQHIRILNGTPWDFVLDSESSQKMNSWNFPSRIPSGTSANVYIEFETTLGFEEEGESASVKYKLADTSKSFSVGAGTDTWTVDSGHWYIPNPTFHQEYVSWDLSGLPGGSLGKVGAGADRSGDVVLDIVGWMDAAGIYHFPSLSDPSGWSSKPDWMYQSRTLIGDRPLGQIVMPGSHDAAMSSASGGFLGNSCNAQTQTRTVASQLQHGSRYFDLRPVIVPTVDVATTPFPAEWVAAEVVDLLANGRLTSGHYQSLDVTAVVKGLVDIMFPAISSLIWALDPNEHDEVYLGANGQSIDSVIDDIDNFLSNHNEVVILDLSHGYQLKNGYFVHGSGGFNKKTWGDLVDHVAGRLAAHLPVGISETQDRAQITYNQLTQYGSKGVVLIVAHADLQDNAYWQRGQVVQGQFWDGGRQLEFQGNLESYNCYAGTNDVDDMIRFQAERMKEAAGGGYFSAASWTLTQSAGQAIMCDVDGALSFLVLDPASPLGSALKGVADYFTTPITSLAATANGRLETDFLAAASQGAPNIIYVDRMEDYEPLRLAMALNYANAIKTPRTGNSELWSAGCPKALSDGGKL